MVTHRGLECSELTLERRAASGERRTVLDALDVRFDAGELAVLHGPTGAGKSSLLHVLAGLLRPTGGEIRADGQPVSRWLGAHRDRFRRRVGLAFQHPQLWLGMSALENVMLPLVVRGGRLSRHRREAAGALDRLGAGGLGRRDVAELSAGEQQRVGLARALVGRPDYVLVDEPSAHQDETGVELIRAALREETERDAAVVVATHDPRLVESGSIDRRWRLEGHRLVSDDAGQAS